MEHLTHLYPVSFDQPGVIWDLAQIERAQFDQLDFGVIGFDANTLVRQYNRFESEAAGLSPTRVLGQPLFASVAPCMNNYLVAQRFADAVENGAELDTSLDYVLTLRMRPVKVRLRLLADPGVPMRFVLVQRRA